MLELSPPSKSAPPLSETASATAPGRPQDARGTMHSSSALLTKHAGTTPRSDSLSSSTNARPRTAATVPPLAAPARDESAESAGFARYRKRALSPCAGDPVTAAVLLTSSETAPSRRSAPPPSAVSAGSTASAAGAAGDTHSSTPSTSHVAACGRAAPNWQSSRAGLSGAAAPNPEPRTSTRVPPRAPPRVGVSASTRAASDAGT